MARSLTTCPKRVLKVQRRKILTLKPGKAKARKKSITTMRMLRKKKAARRIRKSITATRQTMKTSRLKKILTRRKKKVSTIITQTKMANKRKKVPKTKKNVTKRKARKINPTMRMVKMVKPMRMAKGIIMLRKKRTRASLSVAITNRAKKISHLRKAPKMNKVDTTNMPTLMKNLVMKTIDTPKKAQRKKTVKARRTAKGIMKTRKTRNKMNQSVATVRRMVKKTSLLRKVQTKKIKLRRKETRNASTMMLTRRILKMRMTNPGTKMRVLRMRKNLGITTMKKMISKKILKIEPKMTRIWNQNITEKKVTYKTKIQSIVNAAKMSKSPKTCMSAAKIQTRTKPKETTTTTNSTKVTRIRSQRITAKTTTTRYRSPIKKMTVMNQSLTNTTKATSRMNQQTTMSPKLNSLLLQLQHRKVAGAMVTSKATRVKIYTTTHASTLIATVCTTSKNFATLAWTTKYLQTSPTLKIKPLSSTSAS